MNRLFLQYGTKVSNSNNKYRFFSNGPDQGFNPSKVIFKLEFRS